MTGMPLKRGLCALFLAGVIGFGSSPVGAGGSEVGSARRAPEQGDIYLAKSGDVWSGWHGNSRHRGKKLPAGVQRKTLAMPRMITMVKVVNDRGQVVGKRPLPIAAGDLVMQTLKREFTRAGYRVKVVPKLPAQAARGIDLSFVSADLRQSSGLFAQQGSLELRVTLDRWRGGVKQQSLQLTSSASGSGAGDQEVPFPELASRAAQEVADQAYPRLTGAM